MKKALLIFLALITIATLYFYISFNVVLPWNESNAIETTLTWGGLAPLPSNSNLLAVETEGSPFTREFTIEFLCSENCINSWIENSKRLRENEFTITRDGSRLYEILPGEDGAFGGKVFVKKLSSDSYNIKINMSWS
ncbi:MAG TPA: hypothetical protein DF712_10525 [Balneola sp.]|jgi:hypothetical protein|nr:hypothetical protein [Bacteroidota bacterium]MAC04868.1 hypothetical protein [Balneola sp.]MAO78784.1 hypothetical protein [Balneola sp.]MBF64700.1 hypothetical protein [Balneola sp.]HAH51767.1 hypothetical protein [Balneola sp.]|tara:strand:+ start:8104 stop:8514 length:411 start_codon:yes stop_codon:yes gene_type:complete